MAYNEGQNIAKLLLALEEQQLKNVCIDDITVVASGCTDDTCDIVRKFAEKNPKIILIEQKNREGKSAAINLWIKNSASKILVLESADTLPENSTIEKLVTPFENSSIGMTGSHPVPINDPRSFSGFAAHLLWGLHHLIALKKPKMGEMVAFRNVIESIPPESAVDEDSIEAEIIKKGYQTFYCSSAIVRNKGPENIKDFLRQRRRIYAGHLWLEKKSGHIVPTMNGFRIFKLLIRNSSFDARALFFTPLTILLEICGRMLGWYDFRILKKNPVIWKIASSTKNLNLE